MNNNVADIYNVIVSNKRGNPPLVIRTLTTLDNKAMIDGIPQINQKIENYVLLSALPFELKQRVELAIQSLSTF